jgi:Icc-related predicted phosphoesterase
MRILLFSDIHGDIRALERIVLQPADVYIAAGDLSSFGRSLDRCGEVLKSHAENVWVLPGNHETHDETRALCDRFGFFDFHRKVRTINTASGATNWAGLGYSNLTPFNTPGEYSEDEISNALAAFDGIKPLYLVVHFPPRDTQLDQFAPGKHAGSPALRKWVDRAQPISLFCGHIHETAGQKDLVGATQCFNVGKKGYLLEI